MNDYPDNWKKIDELLKSLSDGDAEAMNRLMPLIYRELRRRAHAVLRRERSNHTLRTTALVNEYYIRIAGSDFHAWKNRIHFLRVAARVMRRILIQHLREKECLKRGGEVEIVSVEEDDDIPDFGKDERLILLEKDENLILLEEVLVRLEKVNQTWAEVVEQRFYAGLTIEETAEVMNVSPATVKRKWKLAKAWLLREMTNEKHRRSKARRGF